MKPNPHTAGGLTLIELLLGILSGSILAVLVSAMLVLGINVWVRNQSAARLQDDAALAEAMIVRYLREADYGDVTVNATPPVSLSIVIPAEGRTAVFRDDGAGSLVYEDGEGGGETLVDGTLQALTFAKTLSTASLHMQLEAGDEATELDRVVRYRN